MIGWVETVLISPRFWVATIAFLVLLPFLLALVYSAEVRGDLLALCRGLLLGGR